MTDDGSPSEFRPLQILRLVAVCDAALLFAVSYWLMTGFARFDLVSAIISLALAGALYGATFYFGCLVLAPNLKDNIVSDDTEIKGSNVDMVTITRPSGDPEADKWIASFVFARNLFGMAIVPLLILGGLYLFG